MTESQLATAHDIRQFLDIGTGLSGQIDPTTGGLVGYCAIARKR